MQASSRLQVTFISPLLSCAVPLRVAHIITTMDTQGILALAQFLRPTGSGPSLVHSTDLIALVIHSIQVAVNFRLNPPTNDLQSEAKEDDGRDDDDAVSESDTAVGDDDDSCSPRFPASLGITPEDALQSRLPTGWNSRGEDSYTFTYRHAQSSMGFVVKVGKIGGRVSVMGMAEVSLIRGHCASFS